MVAQILDSLQAKLVRVPATMGTIVHAHLVNNGGEEAVAVRVDVVDHQLPFRDDVLDGHHGLQEARKRRHRATAPCTASHTVNGLM